MKKIAKILIVFCIAISLLWSVNTNKRKISFLTNFPIKLYIIKSGSMSPKIQVGDIILVCKNKDYKEGEVITYLVKDSYFVTHRIIEKTEEGFITKGDNNNTKDENIVKKEQIQGKIIFSSNLLDIIFKSILCVLGIFLSKYIMRGGKKYASKNRKVKEEKRK